MFLAEMDIASNFDTIATARLTEMAFTRLAFQRGWDASVLMLLRHKSSMVTDPRDKIYGICGVASDAGATGYCTAAAEVSRFVLTIALRQRKYTMIWSCGFSKESIQYPSSAPKRPRLHF